MQETEEERGKMLVMSKLLSLDAATILTILVSATDKLRDHLRGLYKAIWMMECACRSWNINHVIASVLK